MHISAILHALVSLNSPSQPTPSTVVLPETDGNLPVTSLINSWKPPRKRKEATMMMSEAKFQKHTSGRTPKHQIVSLEQFDPRPEEYRGTAQSGLKRFLQATKGMGLCLSLLFDESTRVWKTSSTTDDDMPTPLEYNILPKQVVQSEVNSFVESLPVTEADICRIERETRAKRITEVVSVPTLPHYCLILRRSLSTKGHNQA